MKMKRNILTMAMAVMLLLGLCACGTNDNATFNGSKTGDAEYFDIDFEILNDTYTHNLVLKDGDSIAISIEKESGVISLLVQKESGDAVYRGDDVEAGSFEVVISEDGTYTLSVTGEKAKGHVVFTRKEKADVADSKEQSETEDNVTESGYTESGDADNMNAEDSKIENSNMGDEKTEDSNEADTSTEVSASSVSVDQIIGPWHLDDSKMDMDAINEAFPGSMEAGNSMEIRSDGKISWYIGSDGGVGTYELDGNWLEATVTSNVDGTVYKNRVEIQENGDGYILIMSYKDFIFTWKLGE